jgi:hypothetical protein
MPVVEWKDKGLCKGMDTEMFFDRYETDENVRVAVEDMCMSCPVVRDCLATGISQKSWGVRGGIYLENGEISREFSKHLTKKDWGEKWKRLTTV